uniref:Uncharacterized protein n=1 Tax=Romanomermis culicivorax TaxID=13658 RepID=A0A915L3L7_ROMCU
MQCMTDMKAPNYPATDKKKQIIWEIHREYQMEIDKQAELKKKKSLIRPTQLAIPSKFQMKPASIIARTGLIQAQNNRNTNFARCCSKSSCPTSVDDYSSTTDPYARHSKIKQNAILRLEREKGCTTIPKE